jgi:hypothetical protein
LEKIPNNTNLSVMKLLQLDVGILLSPSALKSLGFVRGSTPDFKIAVDQ